MDKKSESNDLMNVEFKDDFVKFGVIGNFTDEDLLLLPEGIVGSLLLKIQKLNRFIVHNYVNETTLLLNRENEKEE